MRRFTGWVVVGLTLASARTAMADAIEGPPDRCPRGHTPETDHGGPYCKPPPPRECPKGYTPRVFRAESYCEPPPPQPCPPGSRWVSRSATDYCCLGGWGCEKDDDCGEEHRCVEASLCVVEGYRGFGRGSLRETVYGTCRGASDCSDDQQCVTKKRCEPAEKRAPVADAPPPPQDPIVPATREKRGGRCGCRAAGERTAGLDGMLLLAALGAFLRRRR